MKKLLCVLLSMGAITAFATEVQLSHCQFGVSEINFTPSAALTATISAGESTVYKTSYKYGSVEAGPGDDLAVVDETPSQTLSVSFFNYDESDGIEYMKYVVSIDLKEPVAVVDGLIEFKASLNNEEGTEGTCSLSL